MTHEYALALLKADLGFYTVSGPVSDLLESKLKAAEKAIAKMGITIDMEDGDDLNLLVMPIFAIAFSAALSLLSSRSDTGPETV